MYMHWHQAGAWAQDTYRCDRRRVGSRDTDLQDRLKAKVWSCSSLILNRISSIIGPQLQQAAAQCRRPGYSQTSAEALPGLQPLTC